MKTATILAGILLVAVIGVSSSQMPLPEEIKQAVKDCLKKLDISEEEHMEAAKANDFSNPKFHCMSECVMTEAGILEDHEIKIEKIKEIMHDIPAAEIEKIYEKCMPQAQQKEDKCDFAREYEKCSIELMLETK